MKPLSGRVREKLREGRRRNLGLQDGQTRRGSKVLAHRSLSTVQHLYILRARRRLVGEILL